MFFKFVFIFYDMILKFRCYIYDINVFKISNVGVFWNNWMILVLYIDYMNVLVLNFRKDKSSFLFIYKVVYYNYIIY